MLWPPSPVLGSAHLLFILKEIFIGLVIDSHAVVRASQPGCGHRLDLPVLFVVVVCVRALSFIRYHLVITSAGSRVHLHHRALLQPRPHLWLPLICEPFIKCFRFKNVVSMDPRR